MTDKITFTVTMPVREVNYLRKVCAEKQLSEGAMLAQALRVYDAVENGIYIQNPKREIYGCMGDD